MPSATHTEMPLLASGKKRRLDDNAEVHMPFTSTDDFIATLDKNDELPLFQQANPNRSFGISRKMIPLPSNKRARVINDDEEDGHALSRNPSYTGYHNNYERLQQEHHHQFSHAHPTLHDAQQASIKPVVSRTNSSALLSPCHICHRKPTKKSDLDSFADCQGCGQRTCYICMRSCRDWTPALIPAKSIEPDYSASFTMQDVDDEIDQQQHEPESGGYENRREPVGHNVKGWVGNGHRSTVCSRCCVERGSEGEVVCLGCLAGLEGA
ncbi:hypothetical protein PG996_001845 [Apiospora saccharicola]|uniref:IBR domain-containing protein n=1 Tax=Apiospora saccharicola TaxID=335842 RepID=A0ABR1WHS0_9PEZI